MSTITSINKQTQPQNKLFIKVKEKTIIYYSVTENLTDDQLEDMMVESIPFGYTESYV